MSRRSLALRISFEGTHFWGWKKTGSGKSVEDALQNSLEKLLRHPVKIQAASRLDRGVHAHGQIATFETDSSLEVSDLVYRLNCLLPTSVRVIDGAIASSKFHPTLDVEKKEYRYLIDQALYQSPFHRHLSWHVPGPLSLKSMQEAAFELQGKKDFKTFCNQRKGLRYQDFERTILDIKLTQQNDQFIEISIIGDHFLYKMARNIVGLLVGYGRGKPLLNVHEIIQGKERSLAFVTAPAQGLTLYKITYPQSKDPFL